MKLGVVMDPIQTIKPYKDSTFAMLLAAQERGWEIFYMEQADLFYSAQQVQGRMRKLQVMDDQHHWFDFGMEYIQPLSALDVILMRKDPPFDLEYIYTTYLLEQAEHAGVLVVNKPQSLRDANEKLFTMWFTDCCPATLVTCNLVQIKDFLKQYHDIICKPLDGMGGASIFRITEHDPNISVIIETLSDHGKKYFMAQRYIPEISQGDKRILMIDGEPVPYALARIPAAGETRGNLAAGGTGVGIELSSRDYEICRKVGPTLKAKGLLFVGLDVIGDYLTEVNVTSPTCIRELDRQFNLNISQRLLDVIAKKIRSRS